MNDIDDKLRLAFVTVMEQGSFAAAGRTLSRDPSVLSRHVAALERQLGIRLLERSTRRVSATATGARYYDKVSEALRLLREAEHEARATAETPSGLLRVTLPTAFGRRWVAPALPLFLQQYPEVRIDATLSDRHADLIDDGFDVAIRIGTMPDSQLVSRQLAPTRRVLCAAPAYLSRVAPLRRPEDLQRVNCLLFTPMASHPVWHFQQNGMHRAVRVDGQLATDDIDTLIGAAVAGAGVLVAADWLVADELDQGRLVEVLDDWQVQGEAGVFLVRASKLHEAARTRVFCDWIIDHLAAIPWQPKVAC